MKTRFNLNKRVEGEKTALSARAPYHSCARGLTLLEMMVAMTLLTVIVLGLTAMFLQTQKAFKGGLKQVDMFEGARSAMAVISRDFEQMADGQSMYITNFLASPSPYGNPYPFPQFDTNGIVSIYRTNWLQDVYSLSKVGRTWYATGYAVKTNGPGIGTLYRYCASTNSIRPSTNLYWDFSQCTYFDPRFYRVADGIVHFRVRAFNSSGRELVSWPLLNQVSFPYVTNSAVTTIPSCLEIELGVLEPEVIKQLNSLPTSNAKANYLASRLGKVHIFRQQIPIRTAPR